MVSSRKVIEVPQLKIPLIDHKVNLMGRLDDIPYSSINTFNEGNLTEAGFRRFLVRIYMFAVFDLIKDAIRSSGPPEWGSDKTKLEIGRGNSRC